MTLIDRVFLGIGGLSGAAGVGAAAASAHGGDQRLMSAVALVALTHGALLVALSLLGHGRWMRIAAALIAIGILLFCGDLAMRAAGGAGLFPNAAPAGGMTLIAGWLALTVAAMTGARGPAA